MVIALVTLCCLLVLMAVWITNLLTEIRNIHRQYAQVIIAENAPRYVHQVAREAAMNQIVDPGEMDTDDEGDLPSF